MKLSETKLSNSIVLPSYCTLIGRDVADSKKEIKIMRDKLNMDYGKLIFKRERRFGSQWIFTDAISYSRYVVCA